MVPLERVMGPTAVIRNKHDFTNFIHIFNGSFRKVYRINLKKKKQQQHDPRAWNDVILFVFFPLSLIFYNWQLLGFEEC